MKTFTDEEQAERDDLARAIRETPKPTGTRLEKFRHIVAHWQGARVEGHLVDGFTASAVLQVHDALNPENQKKIMALPLLKMVDVVWKLIKKQEAKQ